MPSISIPILRQYLKQFEFKKLFNQLGWDNHSHTLPVIIDSNDYTLSAIAQKRGYSVYLYEAPSGIEIAANDILVKIERQVTKSIHEHLIIYVNGSKTTQVWQFAKRESGKPTYRTYRLEAHQSGESLAQKLFQLAISIDEEEQISLVEVTRRTSSAFYVEKITKKFYEDFKEHHELFLKFLSGIPDEDMQRWYVSIMLNRLMFIYFIQKKNFLNGDPNYLRTKLRESKKNGKDLFYEKFLTILFFEGFAKKESSRSASSKKLLGNIPYLNGGLFLPHEIEKKYGKKIVIPDSVFDKLFEYFERYNWHLDERPIRDDKEINPDVLGYIFEKYINQKQMGAFYTKEDITGYNSRNTIIPRIFDIAKEKCEIAFEGDHSIWKLLQADPNRYIYEAVKKGVDLSLPKEIESGIKNVNKRTEWNKPASTDFALPTEIWREVVARRERYQEVFSKLANGEIRDINDFITYNLDIQQFAQDVIETCEGPELLRAFWFAIENLTVLDPTSGSGAFLFAALNILELLYEACLDRMQDFVDAPLSTKHKQTEKYADFRIVLDRIAHHPNKRYFIYKSIIVKNLFGVDIMEEAVEICKLRLFLKLVAQIDDVKLIEPLPDIDFNIRAGNSLVGFARMEDYNTMFDNPLGLKTDADLLAKNVNDFHNQQLEQGSADEELKKKITEQLEALTVRFNDQLRPVYGFKKNEAEEFIKTYQPFHWCIEFFSIMTKGGFDVIIGNPPYVEYGKIKNQYKLKGYESESCGNLYAYVMERSLSVQTKNGRSALIIPISFVSSERMISIRNKTLNQSSFVWISNFAIRPQPLFPEIMQRNTIVIAKSGGGNAPLVYTSNYIRWTASERDILFQRLSLIEVTNLIKNDDIIPKVYSAIDRSIFEKMMKHRTIVVEQLKGIDNSSLFFHDSGESYWTKTLWSKPKAYRAGKLVEPSQWFEITITKSEKPFVYLLLNSNLFYWLWTVNTDCRHMTKGFIENIPIPRNRTVNDNLVERLTSAYKQNTTLFEKRPGYKSPEIKVQKFKSVIDEIDQMLAEHYGFTEEELDFIINYDIKYRMGKQEEE